VLGFRVPIFQIADTRLRTHVLSDARAQSDSEIQLCVSYVAQEINKRFVGQPIVLCAILKGAYMFLSDLTKQLNIPYTTYFVEASSYGDSQVQSDNVQLLSQLVPSKFHNRKVRTALDIKKNATTEVNRHRTPCSLNNRFSLSRFLVS
jgi:hypoxanthine phosphoribosyltransferase